MLASVRGAKRISSPEDRKTAPCAEQVCRRFSASLGSTVHVLYYSQECGNGTGRCPLSFKSNGGCCTGVLLTGRSHSLTLRSLIAFLQL